MNSRDKRDWRISATLLAVWLIALVLISGWNDEIPVSMLAIASIFFVFLIPAMNDLVRSIETFCSGRFGAARNDSGAPGE